MPKNLELKAVFPSLGKARTVCARIGAKRAGLLRQTDTYFNLKKGRMKLREINRREFELIYYQRKNLKGSRYSDYVVVPLEEPDSMKFICKTLFGVKAVVSKNRLLFLYKNARIHIDAVKGLGTFVEFEVIVKYGTTQAVQLMEYLIVEFGIEKKSTLASSYVDMMVKK